MLVFLAGLWVSAGYAGDDESQANQLFNRAKTSMEQGDFANAVDELTKAWTLFSHPLIIKKRAQCYEKMGMLDEAIADYKTFMKIGRVSNAERRKLTSLLNTLDEKKRAPVSVTITSLRVGLLVSVAGEPAKRVPFTIQLKPGSSKLIVEDPRYERTEQTFRVRALGFQVVDVAGVERLGGVVVEASDGDFEDVAVYIDSRRIPVTAEEGKNSVLEVRSIGVGEHLIRCDRGAVIGTAEPFLVEVGTVVRVVCSLPSSPPQSLWFWGAVSAGSAGVVAGVGLFTSYALDKAHADDTHQRLISSKPWVGGILLALGVGFGVSSIFLYDADPTQSTGSETPEPTVFVHPTEDGGYLFGLSGRF